MSGRGFRQRVAETGALGAKALGYILAAVVGIVLIVGGGVYRTECLLPGGRISHGWELGDKLPYLTGAHPDCVNHSLTRYVLGKTGVMSDVN